MKRLFLILFFVSLLRNGVYAQQGPLYSQYSVNKFLVNPAIAGSSGYTTVNMIAREQYTSFVNSPRTFAFTGQTRLLDDSYIKKKLQIRKKPKKATRDQKIGLGANIFNDRNGIISKTGIEFTYAYHLTINNDYQLSFGISGSGFQYKLDDSQAYIYNPDDPFLAENRKSFWVPDAAIGTYFTNNQIYAGLSMNNLFGSSLKLGKSHFKDNFRTARTYNVLAGYRYQFNDDFTLEPSLLFRAGINFTLLDITSKLTYMNDYWVGLSYRSDKTLVTMLGLSYQVFYFGYAYDSSFSTVQNFSGGSHEILLGVRFGDNSSRRFRWVKQDQINYE